MMPREASKITKSTCGLRSRFPILLQIYCLLSESDEKDEGCASVFQKEYAVFTDFMFDFVMDTWICIAGLAKDSVQ